MRESQQSTVDSRQSRGVVAICALVLGLAGCPAGGGSSSPVPAAKKATANTTVEIRTASVGLSGLDMASDGTLWVVPERQRLLIPIAANGDTGPVVPLTGIPDGVDTESVAWLGKGEVALGLEAPKEGLVMINGKRCDVGIMVLDAAASSLRLARCLALPMARWNMSPEPNRGVEGLCHAGGLLAAALETVVERGGKRVAPMGVYDLNRKVWQAHTIAMSSEAKLKGKISALHCDVAPSQEGGLTVTAVERHFQVRRVVRYQVPANAGATPLAPTVLLNLTAAGIKGDNPEGLVRLDNKRWAVINDNHYGRQMGPSYLATFEL